MDAATSRLLDVWRRSTGSLPQCRSALASNDQDVSRAVAMLLGEGAVTGACRAAQASAGLDDPLESLQSRMTRLADWKRRATAQHGVVFVSDTAVAAARRHLLMPAYGRWPFWCSVPVARFIDVDERAAYPARRSHFGGYVRTRLLDEAGAPTWLDPADGWFMAIWDARFMLAQLRHVGVSWSTLVFGQRFQVTASTSDDDIDALLLGLGLEQGKLGDVDNFGDISDGAHAEQIRTRHPDRNDSWPDPCTASFADRRYAWAVAAMGVPDMLPAAIASPVVDAIATALGTHGVPHSCAVFECDDGESHPAAVRLDRLVMELGHAAIGPGWRKRSRDDNRAVLSAALSSGQAYRQELLPAAQAEHLVERFMGCFADTAECLQNGTFDPLTRSHALTPLLGSTFELGAAFVDQRHVGLLLVGDED
jgi:hypothetical protein